MMPRHKRTAPIGQCTGFRKKRSRKMDRLKAKNGKTPHATLGTGGTTAKKDLAFSI
jgi:hypothetical protein